MDPSDEREYAGSDYESECGSIDHAIEEPLTRPGGLGLPRIQQIGDEDLIDLPIRDLNRLLKSMDKDTAARLKQRRRTLKNRGYAQSCRSRRVQVTTDLEKSKRDLEEQISATTQELDSMRQERDWYKRQLLGVLKTKGASREELKAQLMAILKAADSED